MRAADLAPFRPTAEVLALGEPERVFVHSPLFARVCRVACRLLGVAVMLGAAGLAGYFWLLAPADLRGPDVPEFAIAIFCGVVGLLGALFLASAYFYGHASAYALFPDAIALTRRGVWTVIPWGEVHAFRPLSLRAYSHLELRDGTKVPLGADGSSFAAELSREIRRHLDSPFTRSRADRPAVVASAPAPGADAKEADSPWGMLVIGTILLLAAAGFYLYLERLEAERGDRRIHWLIAVASNLGGKVAAAGLIAAVGLGLAVGGVNGLMTGKRPEGRRSDVA